MLVSVREMAAGEAATLDPGADEAHLADGRTFTGRTWLYAVRPMH